MAHANIYIRKENETAWETIEDKSGFVNEAIAMNKAVSNLVRPDLPNNVLEHKKPMRTFEKSSQGFCKNGHPIPEGRDKCMGKGCKFS